MTELQRLHDTDCTLLMGVLNITEDSFSDGGLWLDPGKARDHGDDMLHAGATSSTSARNRRAPAPSASARRTSSTV